MNHMLRLILSSRLETSSRSKKQDPLKPSPRWKHFPICCAMIKNCPVMEWRSSWHPIMDWRFFGNRVKSLHTTIRSM